ncbi:MAG: putative F420-0 ABC transporter substrate-binding protein [Microbacteriaceae bacterium]|nr:MAG: putative F420-0 ABC transporter substrate-binding protein [Microbacteriaceae bacterium]
MRARIHTVLLIGATALALTLSGCSTTATGRPSASASATASDAASGSIDNCGTMVTVGAPSKRIVTIKSSATELLLALGLGKRIVGSAFLDGPIPASLTTHGTPKVISDFLPGQEAVLALQPDFIYGGWESNFSSDGVGERASLARLGIGSYVSPSACKEAAFKPDPLTFDTVFTEIKQAGRVFGANAAAQKLVAQQRAQLAALTPPKKSVSALWYSSGNATPYVGAGIGAPEMIMRASGLDNIFSNVHDTWSSVSWEAIAAANPHVIVLVDADWNTAKSKIGMLETNPVTKDLDAVIHHRFIILPFASTEAGVRNVQAAASVIAQLKRMNG